MKRISLQARQAEADRAAHSPAQPFRAEPFRTGQFRNEPSRIAIVGMGSRGLSVLEQLIGLARQTPGLRLRIDVFEPRAPGGGLHHSEQPDYLMLNTPAGQLSAFSSAFPASESATMTFLQWCNQRGVQLDERGHVVEHGGRPVQYGDFVPRKLLGRYLQACYRLLIQSCPAHVQVQHHAEKLSQCRPLAGRTGFRLVSASGWQKACDAVFLTTGHAPQASSVEEAHGRVAIEGLGLTAMDTLAGLTEGRGGRYVRDQGFAGWRYQPSGREPQVFLQSRSGLPFHARPRIAVDSLKWPRLFFTAAAVDALRLGREAGQLDFRHDVLPLIAAEMRAVFYQTRLQRDAPAQLGRVQHQLRMATDNVARETLFAGLADQWGAFDPLEWMPIAAWSGSGSGQGEPYAAWFRHWIERDLALSRLGAAQSPVKAALEVWRDCRDLLRRVADRHGLTDASTHDFYSVWAGVSNRLVGGPQLERYEDLLALIDAGVVTVLGPGAEHHLDFDQVIPARVAHSGLSGSAQELIADLLQQGLIRAAHPWPADGIDTDALGRALQQDGSVHPRLWVLGPSVEGCTFYNHYVPTPAPACLAPMEARMAAQSCLNSLIGSLSTADCA